jgi:hypothetical protein
MTTSNATTATITFATGFVQPVLAQLTAALTEADFPVIEFIEADEHNAQDLDTLIVDATSDPDDYSVLMAAAVASSTVGLPEEVVYSAEVM